MIAGPSRAGTRCRARCGAARSRPPRRTVLRDTENQRKTMVRIQRLEGLLCSARVDDRTAPPVEVVPLIDDCPEVSLLSRFVSPMVGHVLLFGFSCVLLRPTNWPTIGDANPANSETSEQSSIRVPASTGRPARSSTRAGAQQALEALDPHHRHAFGAALPRATVGRRDGDRVATQRARHRSLLARARRSFKKKYAATKCWHGATESGGGDDYQCRGTDDMAVPRDK